MKKHSLPTMVLLFSGLLSMSSSLLAKDFKTREDNTLHLMSYNIRNGIGMDTVANLERTAEVILCVPSA